METVHAYDYYWSFILFSVAKGLALHVFFWYISNVAHLLSDTAMLVYWFPRIASKYVSYLHYY